MQIFLKIQIENAFTLECVILKNFGVLKKVK